jgi:hypothetical protein
LILNADIRQHDNERKKMKHVIPIATMLLCNAALLPSSRQAVAQTPTSEVSADWKALGWTLPKSFSPDQIARFKGLNAARGTWSFKAETVDADTTTMTGNLVTTGGSQGGMASAWNLVWSWPAENPQHAVVENIVAMPEYENQQFGLMLVRFGPVNYSEAQLKQSPKVLPAIFMGQWDAEKQTVSWTPRALPGKQGKKAATKEDAPAPAFEMVVTRDGKISIQNSENLPTGQISTGGATARIGETPQEPEKPDFLTGMRRFEKGSEISDPRIMRYLPVAATDIRLISDRNGHMAHYRISAEAFDTFLAEVWKRYQEERATQPKSWEHYGKEDIAAARKGSPVGRYEPRVRSTEIIFDEPIVWEPLENATRYGGPRKRSAAGATYYFDRETGIACHDAGYW